jgi:hypothetical protein
MFYECSAFLMVCGLSLVQSAPVDVANNALCAVVPPPKYKAGCEYVVLYDDRFCHVGYECAVPTTTTETPPDFELLLRLSEPCPLLDPFTNSDAHPETDLACDTGLPGWSKQEGCTCVYLVNERDQDERCPISFWRKCTMFNPSGSKAAPCPPISFPNVPEGCKSFKSTDAKGCSNVEVECPKPDAQASLAVSDVFVQANSGEQYSKPAPPPPPPPPPPASADSYKQ